ncbi:MAG: thioesterase domain-containing protein, partial [Planctomycetota bacterium]
AGFPGQMAISGIGLADGYLGDDALTARRFVNIDDDTRGAKATGMRYYLTGDIGRVTADDQLEFLGREDGQIKLRGYRIELDEISEHLKKHPAVDDAAVCVFGDDDSAQLVAVVASEQELPASELTAALPRFKRPDRLIVVKAIPRNAARKVDQAALSDMIENELPIELPPEASRPNNRLESYLVDRWSEVLELTTVSTLENFFDAGGNSLRAATLTSRLSQDLAVNVAPSLIFDLADIRTMATRLAQLYPSQMEARFGVSSVMRRADGDASTDHPLIATWQPSGDRVPIFMIHPPGGIVVCYRDLAVELAPMQPLHAVRSRGLHGDERLPETMEEMAADYADAIDAHSPAGALILGGWSLGGLAAVETASQLMARGREIQRLILLDTSIPAQSTDQRSGVDADAVGAEYGIDLTLQQLSELPPERQLPYLWDHAVRLGVLREDAPQAVIRQTLSQLQGLFHHHVRLANGYRLRPISVPLSLYRPQSTPVELPDANAETPDRGWSTVASEVTVFSVPGHHHSMLSSPHVVGLADHLMKDLAHD